MLNYGGKPMEKIYKLWINKKRTLDMVGRNPVCEMTVRSRCVRWKILLKRFKIYYIVGRKDKC